MPEEEKYAEIQEIVNSMAQWMSFEDELLKLYCSITCLNMETDFSKQVSKDYVQEKIGCLLGKIPIALDSNATVMFIRLKMGQKNLENGEIE